MFDLNQFAAEVHQNAIDHGFWDDYATDERQIALIHSEWSEALQADRSGCTPREVCTELIDGVLRVLDFCAAHDWSVKDNGWIYDQDFFDLICDLHALTNYSWGVLAGVSVAGNASVILTKVFSFVCSYGFDPYEIMQAKHEFNLTRPPKHGKRY